MTRTTRRRVRLGALAVASSALLAAATANLALADPLGSQLRVSSQGPGNGTGDPDYDATDPAAAYNAERNTYLTAWIGDTSTAGEEEVYGRIVAADGSPVGGVIRISDMGTAGDPLQDAKSVRIAYNPTSDEFLVVWFGDHELDGLGVNEDEVWGRRIRGDGGFAGDQFRISAMGPDGNATYEGVEPDVVYNPNLGQYVVVWAGDRPAVGAGEDEIWAKRLAADGTAVDAAAKRVTTIGNEGNATHDARRPAIAYDGDLNQYMVVFEGDPLNNQWEIFGQRLGQGLGEIGADDFGVSEVNGVNRVAAFPDIAYSPVAKRFFTVWDANPIAQDEFEIYGEFRNGDGTVAGSGDFRISTTGPDGNDAYAARLPHVTANDRADEYLVSWVGADDQPGLVPMERERFAQRYTGDGVATGTPEVRVSTMGPAGDIQYGPEGRGGGAYNSRSGEYLVAWAADDDAGGLAEDEGEIYVRRHGSTPPTVAAASNCKPVPARGTPNEVNPPSTITAGYLRTNQRTGSATVRRANALDSWLNGGIVDKDLCGGAVGPAELHPNLTATSGALGPAPTQADPRPVNIPSAGNSNATFTASAIQMCINQRIYQTAIARANALKARLGGELTGGDLTDTTLTQSRLRQDLTITAATDAPAPAKSTTDVKTPTRQGCDAVKFTTAQAAINRRIAIQSVVRINEVLDEVNSGLDGANFKDGTLTKADFAAGVTP